jgi:hypothetical protein
MGGLRLTSGLAEQGTQGGVRRESRPALFFP